MVSNVGNFSGNYTSSKDFENLAKFVLGSAIVAHAENPFDGMGMMVGLEGAMAAWKVKNWLQASSKNGGFQAAWDKDMSTIGKNRDFKSTHDWKQTLNYTDKVNEAKEAEEAVINLQKKIKGEGVFNKIKAFFTRSTEATRQAKFGVRLTEAEKAAKEAAEAVKLAGKTGEAISLGSKALKCLKGNALFWIASSIGELFTIIPTFSQLGAGKGTVQVLKSGAKVAATVVGWEAGAAVGAAIGTLICPVAGTLVGGIVGSLCGLVGGCLGSWAASKLVDPFCKSELDIAKEEQAKKLSQEASQDPEKAKQLLAATGEKLKTEGTNSEDAQIALGSYNKLAQNQTTQTTTAQTTQQLPNGNTPFGSLLANNTSTGFNLDDDLMESRIDWSKCIPAA